MEEGSSKYQRLGSGRKSGVNVRLSFACKGAGKRLEGHGTELGDYASDLNNPRRGWLDYVSFHTYL